jgi:DNA-binding transcriptional LysR family regulator
MGLVAEGLGLAVVPQLVVNPRNPAFATLPFGNRIPPRHLAIVWHRDRYRSPAAEAFVELAREMGADYALRLSEPSSGSAASTSPRPDR